MHDTPGFPSRSEIKPKLGSKAAELLRSSSKEFNPLEAGIFKQDSLNRSSEDLKLSRGRSRTRLDNLRQSIEDQFYSIKSGSQQ